MQPCFPLQTASPVILAFYRPRNRIQVYKEIRQKDKSQISSKFIYLVLRLTKLYKLKTDSKRKFAHQQQRAHQQRPHGFKFHIS